MSKKRGPAVVVGSLLLGSSPFWHLVGRVSDFAFLIDVGTRIGPQAMDFLSSWGWLISVPLGVALLYVALRRPSPKEPEVSSPQAQEKAEVPEKAPEEERLIMPPQSPFPLGVGLNIEDSPGAKAWGNISIDNVRGINVQRSPETELWDNLLIGPVPPDAEDDPGGADPRAKDR